MSRKIFNGGAVSFGADEATIRQIIEESIQVDTTLTKPGQAADAKAVGDRLDQLEDAVNTGLTELDALIGGEGE